MLTMEEIENISFRRAGIGGYKIEDVDTFVDGVIEKVRELELANKELQARIEQLNKQIIKHEAQADSVQDAIITAEITAKKIVRDANAKADAILKNAEETAAQKLTDAEIRANATLSESDTKAQTILNSALSRSAGSIDENNKIIEQQKRHIIQIQAEVTRFRDALIDSYKNHLKLINSLPKAEEFRQYQKKMDESYPPATPVTPASVEQDIREDAVKAVEEAKNEKPEIIVEMVNADKVKEISEEIRTNSKAQEAFSKEQQAEMVEADMTDGADESDEKTVSSQVAEPELTDISSAESIAEPAEAHKYAKEAVDSNADEIRAIFSNEKTSKIQKEEPKPMSIDEIDDGMIFSSSKAEEAFREEHNNRQPIRISDTVEDTSDGGHPDDIE